MKGRPHDAPPTPDQADLLRAIKSGSVWKPTKTPAKTPAKMPAKTPAKTAAKTHGPAQPSAAVPAVVPAMSAAAEVAALWLDRQDERASCGVDWHEGTALGPPNTPAGQRLGAVLNVVEGAVDEHIAQLEESVQGSVGGGSSYSAAHLLSWLRQAQERAAVSDRRAAAAEAAATQRAEELAACTSELESTRHDVEHSAAKLRSLAAENDSLRSTLSAISPHAKAAVPADEGYAEDEAAAASTQTSPALALMNKSAGKPSPPLALLMSKAVGDEGCAAAPEHAASAPSSVAERAGARVVATEPSSLCAHGEGPDDSRLSSAWVALRSLQTSLLLSAQILDDHDAETASGMASTAERGGAACSSAHGATGGGGRAARADYGLLGPLVGAHLGAGMADAEVASSAVDGEAVSLDSMLAALQAHLATHAAGHAAAAQAAQSAQGGGAEGGGADAAGRAAVALHAASLLPDVSAQLRTLTQSAETTRVHSARQVARLVASREALTRRASALQADALCRRVLTAWRSHVREAMLRVELSEERQWRVEAVSELRAAMAENMRLHIHVSARGGATNHRRRFCLHLIPTRAVSPRILSPPAASRPHARALQLSGPRALTT